jgi:ATP-dependent Lon protease
MTGEVTLRGNVLAIGGLKEKTMAAYAAGITTVCIPADNMGDLDEIDPIVRENLTFIPCRKAGEVLAAALVLPEKTVKAPAEVSEGLNLPEVTVRPSTTL